MKILAKNGPAYLVLGAEYQQKLEGEKKLLKVIEYLSHFRMKPSDNSLVEEISSEGDLRRNIFVDFPVMSKL